MSLNCFTHEPTSSELLEKIRISIPSYISGKRLIHTFAVEKEAIRLAKLLFPVLNIDEKYLSDISAAALLHDMTKYKSPEEQLALCDKYGMVGFSTASSAVLHARTGAFSAREIFGVNDTVFSAIFCHTTGKENMNIFEKIIFIADYIEETRTHPQCIKAREYFYSNLCDSKKIITTLDMTIIMSLDSTLSFLKESGAEIDSDTIKARNFLLAEYALQRSVQE